MSRPTSPRTRDVLAGATTAVLLVPQAMAYATLAGLPPVAGLYASTLPLFAYALVGRSPRLAVGPVAMDSLLTAATVGAMAEAGGDDYAALAVTLALLVGAIQLGLGLLRGGFVVNLISRPVIVGFTSAAALVIAGSQLGTLTGIALPRASSALTTFASFASRVGEANPHTVGFAVGAVASLVVLKRVAPRLPRALIVVAVTAAVGVLVEGGDIETVGDVRAGLPALVWPALPDGATLAALFPGALAIARIGFVEAVSVHTALGCPNRPMDADCELLGLGAANVAASMVGAFPVAGGLSRSAVNAEAGATSRCSGVVTGLVVVLTLSFLSELLAHIPRVALGAIIVVAVVGLIDVKGTVRLFRVKRSDFVMSSLTFACTLLVGIRWGVLVGVGLSLLALVQRATRPHAAVLGRLPGTENYRNVARFPEALRDDGVVVLRLDTELFFGNVNVLRERLRTLETNAAHGLYAVVLDASGINHIDAGGEAALRDLHGSYAARGIRFILAEAKGPVRDVLRRSGLMATMGPTGIVRRTHDAVTLVTRARLRPRPAS